MNCLLLRKPLPLAPHSSPGEGSGVEWAELPKWIGQWKKTRPDLLSTSQMLQEDWERELGSLGACFPFSLYSCFDIYNWSVVDSTDLWLDPVQLLLYEMHTNGTGKG